MDVRIDCNLEAYDETYDCYYFRLVIAFSVSVARFIRRPPDAGRSPMLRLFITMLG